MLTKSESAELLQRLNAYVVAVTSFRDTDSDRRGAGVDRASQALEALLQYVEEIS